MLRRGNSNHDSLPTHGGVEGGSSSRGYGGYSRQSSGRSLGGMYGDSSKYHKPQKGGAGGFSPFLLVAIGVGIFNLIMTGLWMSSRGSLKSVLDGLNAKDAPGATEKLQWSEQKITDLRNDMRKETRDSQRRHEKRLAELQSENKKAKRERDQLRNKYESPKKREDDTRLKQREAAFLQHIEHLQRATRRESRRTVLERFGPGPHEVQLTFIHNNVDYDIVIELAPLHTVPHAVHLFLEQVEHGLWAGTYFYLNTDHVLQAGPNVDRDEELAAHVDEVEEWHRQSVDAFSDAELDSLAFPDYSHEFPHHAWTVGFAGRPGGTDIYINKDDNVLAHGPGGQIQHVLEEQGDSCFGRITRGREHIEEILFQETLIKDGTDWNDYYQNPVPIVRAVILTPKPASGTLIEMEIPEPEDIQFGRSLKEALAPFEQTLIENPTISVVASGDGNGNDHQQAETEHKQPEGETHNRDA